MAAIETAQSGVLGLLDGGFADSAENARLLAHSRDRTAARLRPALGGVLARIHADLLRRGELASERGQRHFLYGIRDVLLESGVQLESLLVRHWCREFDAAIGGGPAPRLSVLNLDGSGDREEELALRALTERLREQRAQALAAIGRHLVGLSGREQVRAAAPELLCRALRATFSEAGLGLPARLELLRVMLPFVDAEFGAVYEAWGAELASAERPPESGSGPGGADDHAAAEAALTGFLALPLPAVAAQLLDGEWRELLRRLHAEGDRDAWNGACAVAAELVWSVRIAPGSQERKMLVGRLPNLLRRLQEGFERLGIDAGRRVEILDALFGVHAAILRGEAPPAIPALTNTYLNAVNRAG